MKDTDQIATQGKPRIEHYFPKGYDPYAEPWKSIRECYNSELAWAEHLRIQLAAEVEKVNKLQEELAAEREKFERRIESAAEKR